MFDINNHGIAELTIRKAEEGDSALLLELIRGLAVYERLEAEMTATVEGLREAVFARREAEAIIAEYNGEAAGFALYFENFSTFLGHKNLYLEDLFVWEHLRGLGIGKALLRAVARVAASRGSRRLDWCCLDWNEPSKAFYRSLGAREMSDWRVFRLEGEALDTFAGKM